MFSIRFVSVLDVNKQMNINLTTSTDIPFPLIIIQNQVQSRELTFVRSKGKKQTNNHQLSSVSFVFF